MPMPLTAKFNLRESADSATTFPVVWVSQNSHYSTLARLKKAVVTQFESSAKACVKPVLKGVFISNLAVKSNRQAESLGDF